MRTILLLVMGWGLILAGFYGFPKIVSGEDDLQFGERVYGENCAACHGEKGDGKGPQAYKLETKPRDFTTGIYKFRSTPSGSLPRDEDIFRTISRGVRGTSMLASALRERAASRDPISEEFLAPV